jgi:hypothetical protein
MARAVQSEFQKQKRPSRDSNPGPCPKNSKVLTTGLKSGPNALRFGRHKQFGLQSSVFSVSQTSFSVSSNAEFPVFWDPEFLVFWDMTFSVFPGADFLCSGASRNYFKIIIKCSSKIFLEAKNIIKKQQ